MIWRKCVKHDFELAVVFAIEFIKSSGKLDVRRKHLPQSHKRTHDLDVDLRGPLTLQNVRQHQDSYIMMRDEIDYAEFRRRAVAARLARLRQGPQIPAALIGQPASTERQKHAPGRK